MGQLIKTQVIKLEIDYFFQWIFFAPMNKYKFWRLGF